MTEGTQFLAIGDYISLFYLKLGQNANLYTGKYCPIMLTHMRHIVQPKLSVLNTRNSNAVVLLSPIKASPPLSSFRTFLIDTTANFAHIFVIFF